MKTGWIIILALTMVTAIFANGIVGSGNPVANNNSRYEVVFYEETFETGATGWTHYDGAVSPNNWHIYNAGGTEGNVWWMGDPALASGANIGGYYDHQYLVLDTPQTMITAGSPNLTFKLRYNVESPAGATAPYTGWDACNVRISTNNGATWTPISGTPAYNITSAYSFGFEHGEGPNIPGWGGALTTWTNATFSLANYVGQNVKIRFAFASDPAYSTGDAPAMFGMMVDDIVVGSYTNNGVNDGQMTWASLVPLGGDIWHLATVTGAPSPTHAMVCSNTSNGYNANMMDYLVSPTITLPATGDIRCDFMIMGSFTDPNAFPECDYFGWEVSIDGGLSWRAMSNPYADPNGSNYVYSDAPDTWSSMTASYSLDGYISSFAGQAVQFRWYLRSDADTPNGTGIMIDDFRIYNDVYIAEPTNLAATVQGTNVVLNWSEPGGGGNGEPGWLHYDSGENASSVGLNSANTWDVAAKFAPDGTHTIAPWVGMNITKIKFFPTVATSQYNVRIWTGPSGGTQVIDQAVTNPVMNAWNEVILTTPFTIPSATYCWFGYHINQTVASTYPAGCDAGPAIAGWGDMIRTGTGSWSSLYTSNPDLNYNWNIQAYVTDATGREYLIGANPVNDRDRDVTAYRIYRNEVQVAEVPPTPLTYTDTNVPGGIQNYRVTAMYGTNESTPSNTVTVFVVPANHSEVGYDDGVAEQGFNVGPSHLMAVKFQHDHVATVRYVKAYINTVGTAAMIFRLYDDDGADGAPNTLVASFTYPVTSFVQGWNYIQVPTTTTATFNDGKFYVAILEYTNACAIGLDTNTTGHSYKKLTTTWEPVTEGDLMIHAIVENGPVANDDNTTPVYTFAASNFPNPFNPKTTINYSVPKQGMTSLKVYNIKGQVVKTLVNSDLQAGNYTITWDGIDNTNKPVSSGVYFYRLINNDKAITKKMLLSK